jgi:hypothetical protein
MNRLRAAGRIANPSLALNHFRLDSHHLHLMRYVMGVLAALVRPLDLHVMMLRRVVLDEIAMLAGCRPGGRRLRCPQNRGDRPWNHCQADHKGFGSFQLHGRISFFSRLPASNLPLNSQREQRFRQKKHFLLSSFSRICDLAGGPEAPEASWLEIRQVLDEELVRLSKIYRTPIKPYSRAM